MNSPLRIRMFGPFHVWRDGEAEDSLQELRAHRMATRLLALLALYPNRPLDKSEATTLLWGGGYSEDNLNKAIQALCRALGQDGGRVSSVSRAVRLDLTGVDVDLLAFDQAWEGRSQDLAPLQAAMEVCEGSLLQGWDDPWVEQARSRYAQRGGQALHLLANVSIEGACLQAARHYLGRLRLAGDCADALHTRLMAAWMAHGAYPDAKQHYEEYRDYLRHQHGLHPPEKMARMYEGIPRVETEFDPPVEALLVEIEAPGGSMPVGSRFYVERPVDRDFHAALARRDGTILINGPRQVGKSSLMARGIEHGCRDGLRVVVTDFQKLDAETLESIDAFYRAVLRGFQRKLSLATRPADYWDEQLSPNENFEGYLQDVVLTEGASPLIWCIDEADRIFDRSYRGSVFGLLRSWHNARAEGPESPWNRLLLILTYSTEAHLFIPDLHQSPFNVGTKLTLEDFTPAQVQQLNVQLGSPLDDEEEAGRLFALVGGHPYLTRLCLYEMKAHDRSVADLEAEADQDFGLFRDHLERLCDAVARDPELADGVRSLLRSNANLSQTAFFRLRSAGVATGKSATSAHLRCGLYDRYFARRLG